MRPANLPGNFLLGVAFLAGAAGTGFGSGLEWEAIMPATVRHLGSVEVLGALETRSGDFLLAGNDAEAQFMIRVDPEGKPRWVNRTPHPGPYGSRFLEIYETERGIASLWACCGNPGWTAVQYDDEGKVFQRMDLGYPRGILNISSDAQVVFISSVMPAPGTRRTLFSAEGRSLVGSGAWKTDLATAIIDEVIGIHAVGDGSVAALNRLGNRWGDTLKLWRLDRDGKFLWTRDLPAGYKAAEYVDYFSVSWSHIAHDTSGRILLSGLPSGHPADDSHPDSLALAVLEPDGSLRWMKRLPVQDRGGPDARGHWEILSLSATPEGIRIRLYRLGAATYWSTVDFSWSGEPLGSNHSPLAGDGYGFFRALPSRTGAYMGIGSVSGSGGIVPPSILDSVWRPSSLSTPILYGPQQGPDGEWRKRLLPEYADTVWVRKKSSPMGDVADPSVGPGMEFLLFTRDGGALAGGRLWRRNGKDTLAVLAIKIPPAEVGIVRPRSRARLPWESWPGGAFRFDAAGRKQNPGRIPLLSFPAPARTAP